MSSKVFVTMLTRRVVALTEGGSKGSSQIGVDEILLALLARCHQARWYPSYEFLLVAVNLYLVEASDADGLFHLQRLDRNVERRNVQLLVELTSLRVRGWLCWDSDYRYPMITREGLQRAESIHLPADIERLAQLIIEKILLSKQK